MSEGPEAIFKRKVLKRLSEIKDTWCFKSHEMSVAGIPDIIGCHRGYFFAWELKKDAKSHPTKLQAHILEKIRESNGMAAVVHPENLEQALRNLTSRYTPLP